MYEPQFRCKKNGVPILSHDEIEFHAEQFIKDFNADLLKNPGEVDVESFAEFYLGLTPEYNYLSNCGLILGRMVFNNSNKIAIYDTETGLADYISAERGTVMIDNILLNDEHRLRSTVGHESGHWIYQQGYFYVDPYQMTLFDTVDKTSTACRKFDIEGGECVDGVKRTLLTDHDWLEHQAKYFSAAFLMPKSAMKIVCGDVTMRKKLTEEFPGFEETFLANHVADIFNVSSESAKIRIKQLGLGFEAVRNAKNTTMFTIGYPESVFSL